MNDKPRKFGWQVKGILGLVFVPIGLLYAVLGFTLWMLKAGDEPEEPLVFLCVFGGIGLILLLAGLPLLLSDLKRRRSQRRAYESGRSIPAVVTGAQMIRKVTRNFTHPWTVECTFRNPDTGREQVCQSRYVFFDPREQLMGKEVPVYLDPVTDQYVFADIDAVLSEKQDG